MIKLLFYGGIIYVFWPTLKPLWEKLQDGLKVQAEEAKAKALDVVQQKSLEAWYSAGEAIKKEGVALLQASFRDNYPHYDSTGGYWQFTKYFLPDGTRVEAVEKQIASLLPPAPTKEELDRANPGSGVSFLKNEP